jgi:Xaa-Pro dipeptidase
MRVLESQALQTAAPHLGIVAADSAINALRGVKDAAEIAAMDRAVSAAETAMHNLIPRIRLGMSEKELVGLLTLALLDAGADAPSFDPIVAAGSNSAIPHAVPTGNTVREGELLLFDWGALVDGYASDITRTFAIGEIDPELRRIYEIVRLANEAGKAAVRPGVHAEEVDAAARKLITEAGYGDQFTHRTGHGLGMEVHEEPSLVAGHKAPLQVGNVFTVEPGIYLEGRGGVRIEDDVLVTTDGYRSLTTFPRELITIEAHG